MLKCRSLPIFPVSCSVQLVLKWNSRALRPGSGQNGRAYGSGPLSSPAPVGQSVGIWIVVAGKMCARALDLSISTGQDRFFWPARPGKMKAIVNNGR